MSGRSYTPVELPKETLEDIQRKTDVAVQDVLSRLQTVTLAVSEAERHGSQTTRGGAQKSSRATTSSTWTAAVATARATTLKEALEVEGETEAALRLQAAAPVAKAATATGPSPEPSPAERAAVARYEAEEARALAELRDAKARKLRLLEVARVLADARPRGIEVRQRTVGADGAITIAFARPTDRDPQVNVTIAPHEGRVRVAADAGAPPKIIDGRPGAVCVGLDDVFAPMLESARAAGRLRVGPTKERRLKTIAMSTAKTIKNRATRSGR